MKYITVACLIVFYFLSLINIASAETGSDMAVLPAPITCYGEVTTQGYIKCRWFRGIINNGPGNPKKWGDEDSFYASSPNTFGPGSFQ
ncbi:MAG: hypothetical protein KGJ58_03780 [Patescibacteria group bacterium]|nr:hypothetical protein [Patescibacteria group bacterium]